MRRSNESFTQANAANKQGTLVDFMDVSSGSGTFAPRNQRAYSSKRLQELVKAHRREQKRKASGISDGSSPMEETVDITDTVDAAIEKPAKRKKAKASREKSSTTRRKSTARKKVTEPDKSTRRSRDLSGQDVVSKEGASARPKRRPRPAYVTPEDNGDFDGDDNSSDEYVE
jgi:DNA excision repair protein ERCC-5